MSLEKKARATKKDLAPIVFAIKRGINLSSTIRNANVEADFNNEIKEMLERDVTILAREYYSVYGSKLRKDVITTISRAYRFGHERGKIVGNPDYKLDFDIP